MTVTDANDNPPVFLSQEYTAFLAEDVGSINPKYFVASVSATDADIGTNAVITYSVSSTAFMIEKDAVGGGAKVYISNPSQLDYEKITFYDVTVTATDGGTPPLSGTSSLKVSTTDVNDNAPVFTQPNGYSQVLAENTYNNTVALLVRANDADSGANGRVVYSMDASTKFEIRDPTTGAISTKALFDSDVEDTTYTFKVYARDQGTPQRSTEVVVSINILDVNDLNPEFPLALYQKTLDETNTTNVLIINVVATEKGDINSAISYNITNGDETIFKISTIKTGSEWWGRITTIAPSGPRGAVCASSHCGRHRLWEPAPGGHHLCARGSQRCQRQLPNL